MLSTLSKAAWARASTLAGGRHVLLRVPRVAGFHSVSRPLLAATEAPAADAVVASEGLAIDKENPLHAPDNQEPWRNAGYSNLAPAGWKEWEDLPAPYKYYDVKLDPKDVENEGMIWKLFTNWKTGIPLASLLALPAFVFDVVIIDERFELMLIFWTTMAVFQANFGSAIKSQFTDMIDEIRSELMTAESKYNESLSSCLDTHKKAMHVGQYLKMIHEGERALRAVEAQARTRAVKIDQRNKMEAMLDYLVMVKGNRDAAIENEVTTVARLAVEAALASDSKLQQTTIDNAIAALAASKTSDSIVEDLYAAEFKKAQEAATAKLASSKGLSPQERDLFEKRFGAGEVVTETMHEKAKSDPAEWAVLTARCGGASPVPGAKITYKPPTEYYK